MTPSKLFCFPHEKLFTDDEIQVTADHLVRPIMVPRDVHILPWFAGYAEAINAGKSLRNEDQVRDSYSYKLKTVNV